MYAIRSYYEKHTEALEKKNKDCTVCHLTEKDLLVSKYMRIEDTAKQVLWRSAGRRLAGFSTRRFRAEGIRLRSDVGKVRPGDRSGSHLAVVPGP